MEQTTLYLIPGFMSPAWMMIPMQRYLQSTFSDVRRWDYPRVFTDPDSIIDRFVIKLAEHSPHSVAIVAHSFGDWVVRSALRRSRVRSVKALVSVCPVVTRVAAARLAMKVGGGLIPELAVMADKARCEVQIPEELNIARSVIWARGELLISQGHGLSDRVRQRRVLASHNSVLFQPNGWRAIREELQSLLQGSLA